MRVQDSSGTLLWLWTFFGKIISTILEEYPTMVKLKSGNQNEMTVIVQYL
jgi:hypothetical protein